MQGQGMLNNSVALTTSAAGGSVTGGSAVGNGTAAMELTRTITGPTMAKGPYPYYL
jgi:hypothetical protein